MENSGSEPLWGHIYTLIVLGEVGSYTAAATRLSVTKSAVSQRIAELERIIEMPLVQRTTRSVRLTAEALRFIEANRSFYEGIERNYLELKDSKREPRGLVRVTAPVALGRQQIVPRLSEFMRSYPDVRVELELTDQLVSLAREGFDLAIRHTNAAPDTHIAWTICGTEAVLVATQEYLQRNGSPDTPTSLLKHECLHYLRRGQVPTWSFAQRVRNGKQISIPISGPLSTNNSEALREAALSGMGIALVPDFSALSDLKAGRLLRVLPQWKSIGAFGERLYVIRPYSPYISRPVRVFVDFIRSSLHSGFSFTPEIKL
ncbi:LysR family transcriptional regulator [Herbaspirillum robiniae]|uniref:LysR family transcriptional regulator n=1 Tax=Herbaspirillum robiniae TaxID=2014887 RepID=UPI003D78A7DE